MSDPIIQPGHEEGKSLVRGGLGFLAGLLLCGVALAAQAALLHAVAGAARKSS
jgi:hypothetical protein